MTKKSENLNEIEETKTTDLVPVVGTEEHAIDQYDGSDDDYEGDEEGEQSIPKLIIVQKSHDELVAAGHLGNLYSPDMSQAFDKLNVVMLIKWSSRVLWPDKFNKENEPICRSRDGKVPAGDILDESGKVLAPMSQSCDWDKATLGKRGVFPSHVCPYANWTGTKENSIPPACTEVINLILLDLETEIPFHFCLSSTTLTPFRNDLTKPMGYRKMSLTAKRKKKGLGKALNCMFSFSLSIDPTDRQGGSGSSKLPLFENIVELDDNMIETCLRWREGLVPFADMMKSAAPVNDAFSEQQSDISDDDDDFS